MGTWNSGPFDNDTAQDFLGDLVDYIAAAIEEDLHKARGGTSVLEWRVVAGVSVLRLLAGRIRSVRVMVSREKVQRWQRDYLEWFDAVLAPAAGAETARRYRREAQKQFKRLLDKVCGEDEE